jgi:hypothetical protein
MLKKWLFARKKNGLRSGGRRGENYRSPWSLFEFSTPAYAIKFRAFLKLLLLIQKVSRSSIFLGLPTKAVVVVQ